MSQKRSEASRINGAKGKGPTSPEGKKRVRTNARKLGLYSSDVVVTTLGETKEEYEVCREGFFKVFSPEDAVEEAITEDLIENWWRRRRVRRSESDAIRGIDLKIVDSTLSEVMKRPKVDDVENLPLVSVDTQMAENVLSVSNRMSRAETRYDRAFYKAVSTLWVIKALKAKIGLAGDSLPQLQGTNSSNNDE